MHFKLNCKGTDLKVHTLSVMVHNSEYVLIQNAVGYKIVDHTTICYTLHVHYTMRYIYIYLYLL